jgi:hypothetical protein
MSNGESTFLEKRDTSFMAEYYNTPGTLNLEFLNIMPIGMLITGSWLLHLDSTYLITLAYTNNQIQ